MSDAVELFDSWKGKLISIASKTDDYFRILELKSHESFEGILQFNTSLKYIGSYGQNDNMGKDKFTETEFCILEKKINFNDLIIMLCQIIAVI